jgi:CarD family transcriptional regulator
MIFEVGDYVVVPGHGVGQLIGEETRQHLESSITFLSIKMIATGSRVSVPLNGKEAIRKIISVYEAHDLYHFLKDHESIRFNRQTWNRRYRDYMAKINTGSILEVADVLREMLMLKMSKKLSYSEKRVLELCKDMVVKEMSVTLGKDEQEISSSIDNCFGVTIQ